MTRRRWELLTLAVILLAAGFLRLYRLDSAPPGLTHDEADTGYFVAAVYRGEPSDVEAPYGYANEKFTMVSGALMMALAGPTDLALRLHAAFFGLLMLVFGYLWLRTAFDPAVALVTTGLTAVSFWTVATSRFALNPQPAPALFAGAVWLLWLAWFRPGERRRWWAAVGAGLLLGGSLWAYEVARATAVAILALVVWLALVDRAALGRGGRPVAAALALGLLLAAPHLLDPAAWQRSATLATTWQALLSGDPGPLLAATWEGLGILFVRGDPFVTYNLPGLPLMNPVLGALFLVGVLICLRRWREPAPALALLWLGFGLGPVILTGAYTSTLHAMGIQPVVYLFPALAAVEGRRWLVRRYGARARQVTGGLVVALILVVAVVTARDYFVRWARSPETAAAYFSDLAAATDLIQDSAPAGVVTLSSPFPDLPHDPFVADLRVRRDDVTIRWVDGRSGLIYPADMGTGDQLLLVLQRAPLAPELRPTGLTLLQEGAGFAVYRWDPGAAWEVAQMEAGVDATPVDLGALVFHGTRVWPAVAPGETITVATLWQVGDPALLGAVAAESYGRQAAVFLHLMDPAGNIVVQDDGLGVPAWDWRPGDRFIQLHRLALAPDIAPGTYRLVVGVYTVPDMVRLTLPTGADSWELGTIEVEAP